MRKLLILLILAAVIFIVFQHFLSSSGCYQDLNPLDNSSSTKEAVECFLNNEKSRFTSSVDGVTAAEILSGKCSVTWIRNTYLDGTYNQKSYESCSNCRRDGLEVLFKCEGYEHPPFGCFFDLYLNKTFGDIYCPFGV